MLKVFIYTVLIVLDIVVLLMFRAILYVDKIVELEEDEKKGFYDGRPIL